MDSDGSNLSNLTNNPASDGLATWQSDGFNAASEKHRGGGGRSSSLISKPFNAY